MVHILLMLEVLFTQDCKVEDPFCCASSCSEPSLFFSHYFFSLEFKSIQDDCQHDFARIFLPPHIYLYKILHVNTNLKALKRITLFWTTKWNLFCVRPSKHDSSTVLKKSFKIETKSLHFYLSPFRICPQCKMERNYEKKRKLGIAMVMSIIKIPFIPEQSSMLFRVAWRFG